MRHFLCDTCSRLRGFRDDLIFCVCVLLCSLPAIVATTVAFLLHLVNVEQMGLDNVGNCRCFFYSPAVGGFSLMADYYVW